MGSERSADYESERQSFYQQGLPNFQLQVTPRTTNKESGIDLLIGFANASLVFLRSGSRFEATLSIEVQVFEPDKETPRFEKAWPESILVETYQETQITDIDYREEYLQVSPGEYKVQVVMSDLNTGKRAVRRQNVVVHSVVAGAPGAGEMHFRTRQKNGSYEPFIGNRLPQTGDSLRCSFTVYGLSPDDNVNAVLTVIKYQQDTSIALPPYTFAPTSASLEYTGISTHETDTVLQADRLLRGPENEIEFQWSVMLPGPGVYSFTGAPTVAGDSAGSSTLLSGVHGIIAVMSEGFPKPTTLSELIKAAQYLTREPERDSLLLCHTDEESRKWFEGFWLHLSGNQEAAAGIIRQYYTRVEEANLHFSNFKEGWRTDRGMLYIVLGPPLAIQTGINGEVWRYSNSDEDPINTFVFQRVNLAADDWPFDHYILERQAYYDQPWINGVERWRRGRGF